MDRKSDISWIDLILAGNVEAFSFIIDKYKDRTFNLAFRICGNREEAEEVTQDAFLKAYRSLKGFKMKSSFATWLYRIVYNTAVSHIRNKNKPLLLLDDFPADTSDFTQANISEEEAEKEYRNALVNFAMQKITEEERGLISLYYYEDMNTEEISELTGISRSNIKVKLFRARQKMLEIIVNAEKKKLKYHEQV
jgi:RNA polymerase sigma-70 factor (ECF subfamily)